MAYGAEWREALPAVALSEVGRGREWVAEPQEHYSARCAYEHQMDVAVAAAAAVAGVAAPGCDSAAQDCVAEAAATAAAVAVAIATVVAVDWCVAATGVVASAAAAVYCAAASAAAAAASSAGFRVEPTGCGYSSTQGWTHYSKSGVFQKARTAGLEWAEWPVCALEVARNVDGVSSACASDGVEVWLMDRCVWRERGFPRAAAVVQRLVVA